MIQHLRRAIVASIFFAVLCGLAYPLAETGIAQALFPHEANGSLTANGSLLIGQRFAAPRFFQGRPDSYDPMATGPTNLGPRSALLARHVAERVAYWHRLGVDPTSQLVESSGSGVDPDIGPSSAYAQVDMVARARRLPASLIRALVRSEIIGKQLGFLGAPYVNVLALNEALAKLR